MAEFPRNRKLNWTQPLNNFLTPAISAATSVFPVNACELFPCASMLLSLTALLCYSRELGTVLWERWPSTWLTIPSYPWRKWSGSLTASHQWVSRHQGHNLHILTGRTCLGTFSNWHCPAQRTDFILSQTALFSWLHRGSPLLTGKTRKVSLLLIWGIPLVPVLQQ